MQIGQLISHYRLVYYYVVCTMRRIMRSSTQKMCVRVSVRSVKIHHITRLAAQHSELNLFLGNLAGRSVPLIGAKP